MRSIRNIMMALLLVLLSACSSGPSDAPPNPRVPPGQILNLLNWKLTLPTDKTSENEPDEVKQPNLNTYSSVYFYTNGAGDGVIFNANAGGMPTRGSEYARSELREMTNNGVDQANWSSTTGTHTMSITQAITKLPTARPALVAGQVHGTEEYVALINLEGETLSVKTPDNQPGILDPAYKLGTKFTVKIEATAGLIQVFYNDALKVNLERDCNGCYFKAGVYLQSNTDKGDAENAQGEVIIYSLDVTHP